MRRKTLISIIICVIVHCIALSAFAYVPATPNQKLALRTGPNTKYVELYTLPQDTSVTAIEYEEGNGVTWVLLEFRHNGEVVRGYTGLKRLEIWGSIPWANPIGSQESVRNSASVWAAPGYGAAYRGWVDYGDTVTLLNYENNYAYIEFYDYENDAYSRGYIDSSLIRGYSSGGNANSGGSIIITPNNGSKGVSATPNQKLYFRTGPNTAYPDLFSMPQNTAITAYEYEQGNGVTWVLVEFEYQGMRCRGYTGLKRMSVHGSIPWANHLYESAVANYSSTIYAAPSSNAYYRGRIDANQWVTVLDYENGYAYIEYYDSALGKNSRGYLAAGVLN